MKTPIKNDIVEHHSYQREPMRFIDATTLEISREPSDLDRLALEFTTILEKHTPYVIVSGDVSILLGRARASEDIDIIIAPLPSPKLKKLVHDLKEKNFYCLNEEKDSDIFACLTEGRKVRFAKQHTMIPNIELKWAKNRIHALALQKTITVGTPKRDSPYLESRTADRIQRKGPKVTKRQGRRTPHPKSSRRVFR